MVKIDHDGPVEPTFGPVPKPIKKGFKRQVYRYDKTFALLRDHPRQPALIAAFETGHAEVTLKAMTKEIRSIRNYLARWCPFEVWVLNTRRAPDTWSRREIWLTYHGDLPAEQMAELKRLRREKYSASSKGRRDRIWEATERLVKEAAPRGTTE